MKNFILGFVSATILLIVVAAVAFPPLVSLAFISFANR